MPQEPSGASGNDALPSARVKKQGDKMGKTHAEQGTPVKAQHTEHVDRLVIDLPRPTLDQQQFLNGLDSSASKYDPDVLVCGKKLGS